MAYQIRWENIGVYCKFTGIVSSNDLMDCNSTIYASPRFDTLRYQIFDMLNATDIAFTIEDVELAAACDYAASLTNPRFSVF